MTDQSCYWNNYKLGINNYEAKGGKALNPYSQAFLKFFGISISLFVASANKAHASLVCLFSK